MGFAIVGLTGGIGRLRSPGAPEHPPCSRVDGDEGCSQDDCDDFALPFCGFRGDRGEGVADCETDLDCLDAEEGPRCVDTPTPGERSCSCASDDASRASRAMRRASSRRINGALSSSTRSMAISSHAWNFGQCMQSLKFRFGYVFSFHSLYMMYLRTLFASKCENR